MSLPVGDGATDLFCHLFAQRDLFVQRHQFDTADSEKRIMVLVKVALGTFDPIETDESG